MSLFIFKAVQQIIKKTFSCIKLNICMNNPFITIIFRLDKWPALQYYKETNKMFVKKKFQEFWRTPLNDNKSHRLLKWLFSGRIVLEGPDIPSIEGSDSIQVIINSTTSYMVGVCRPNIKLVFIVLLILLVDELLDKLLRIHLGSCCLLQISWACTLFNLIPNHFVHDFIFPIHVPFLRLVI